MKTNEKVELLTKYLNKPELTKKHLKKLLKFADDKDDLVRSMSAALLCNFENKKSKKTLLKLACDKKSLVRTEAYDSLSFFHSRDVEKFLKKAIFSDKNELACSYAILSWADVASALDQDRQKKRHFVSKIKKIHKIQKSEHCMLNCYYAEYILGKRKSIKKILSFLGSEDYHIRCSVINLSRGFLEEGLLEPDAQELIKKSLEELVEKGDVWAVKGSALKLLEMLDGEKAKREKIKFSEKFVKTT